MVELDERGVDIDALAGRPAFVTAVHDAGRIAMGKHIEEKLDMLEATGLMGTYSPAAPPGCYPNSAPHAHNRVDGQLDSRLGDVGVR